MSREQIKIEINNIINHLPDDGLEALLSYLKELQNEDVTLIKNSAIIRKILLQDSDLLSKLAK